jgi:hypothetical protein
MVRTMLQLRIEALGQHLEQAQDPSVWRQSLHLPSFNVNDRMWYVAVEKIHVEAESLRTYLVGLGDELQAGHVSERDGWLRYARVQRASREIFRECLDLLGGLALRDRIKEERICYVADEYISELAGDTGRRESFAIPGLDSRFSSTLRRVAKLQFPEWTVWTLPLVAHEYGHVVVEESGLRGYAAELAHDWAVEEITKRHRLTERLAALGTELGEAVRARARSDLELEPLVPFVTHLAGRFPASGAPHEPEDTDDVIELLKSIHTRQRHRVRILLADALATLLAGPAYGYAALLLRLNPLGPESDLVSDQERAATILAVLHAMNDPGVGSAAPPPHGDIVDYLGDYWRDSVAAARAESPSQAQADADSRPATPIDPDAVRAAFRRHIVGHKLALYERQHSAQAIYWGTRWQTEIEVGAPLTQPTVEPNEHIREAINALWRARLAATRNLDPSQSDEAERRIALLEAVGLDLCATIMDLRRAVAARFESGGLTDPGRASKPPFRGSSEAG